MKLYSCEICKKSFKQKYNYDRHINRKNSCAPNLHTKIAGRNNGNNEIVTKLTKIINEEVVCKKEIESEKLAYINNICESNTELGKAIDIWKGQKKINFRILMNENNSMYMVKIHELIEKSETIKKNEPKKIYTQIRAIKGEIERLGSISGEKIKLKNICITERNDLIISTINFENEMGIIGEGEEGNIVGPEYMIYKIKGSLIKMEYMRKLIEMNYLAEEIKKRKITKFDEFLGMTIRIPTQKGQEEMLKSMSVDDIIEKTMRNKSRYINNYINEKFREIFIEENKMEEEDSEEDSDGEEDSESEEEEEVKEKKVVVKGKTKSESIKKKK